MSLRSSEFLVGKPYAEWKKGEEIWERDCGCESRFREPEANHLESRIICFLFLGVFSKRNRKHVPCCYRVIGTRVEVWDNEKSCANTSSHKLSRVFLLPDRNTVHVFYFF